MHLASTMMKNLPTLSSGEVLRRFVTAGRHVQSSNGPHSALSCFSTTHTQRRRGETGVADCPALNPRIAPSRPAVFTLQHRDVNDVYANPVPHNDLRNANFKPFYAELVQLRHRDGGVFASRNGIERVYETVSDDWSRYADRQMQAVRSKPEGRTVGRSLACTKRQGANRPVTMPIETLDPWSLVAAAIRRVYISFARVVRFTRRRAGWLEGGPARFLQSHWRIGPPGAGVACRLWARALETALIGCLRCMPYLYLSGAPHDFPDALESVQGRDRHLRTLTQQLPCQDDAYHPRAARYENSATGVHRLPPPVSPSYHCPHSVLPESSRGHALPPLRLRRSARFGPSVVPSRGSFATSCAGKLLSSHLP